MKLECNYVHGYASISFPCDVKIKLSVNAANFCKTVDTISGDMVEFKVGTNKLRISGDVSSIEVPYYDTWQATSLGVDGPGLEADANEIVRCIEVANIVSDNVELEWANGIRIHTEGNELHFVSATGKAQGAAWSDYSGNCDMDVVVRRGAVGGLLKLLSGGGRVRIEDRKTHVGLFCQSRAAIIPKEIDGKAPRKLSTLRPAFASADNWVVSRHGLMEFLRQTLVFATPTANRVWLRPDDCGLHCEFTGISDGSNSPDLGVDATCESRVAGEPCTGTPALVSARLLAPAVAALGDDGFVIRCVPDRAIFLESNRAVIGIAQTAKVVVAQS